MTVSLVASSQEESHGNLVRKSHMTNSQRSLITHKESSPVSDNPLYDHLCGQVVFAVNGHKLANAFGLLIILSKISYKELTEKCFIFNI